MRNIVQSILAALLILVSCERIGPEFPDEPVIDYQTFDLFITVDELNNKTLVGKLSFEFTDGDGNLGLPPLPDSSGINLPDTVKYNFFLQLYDLKGIEYEMVPEEDGGILKYRIPYLNKQPLSGTIDLDILLSGDHTRYDLLYFLHLRQGFQPQQHGYHTGDCFKRN